MSREQDIENIIRLLDEKMDSGISRIRLQVKEDKKESSVQSAYHHGRCDVGSPWAEGMTWDLSEVDKKESD